MTSDLVTSVLQLVVGEQPSPGLVEAVTSLVDTTVRSPFTIAAYIVVTLYNCCLHGGHPLQLLLTWLSPFPIDR